MTATQDLLAPTLAKPALRGIVGGLAGGLVFGVLMQMMDMIPMVASLVGSDSVAVGWLVHLAISAFIGATFGVLTRARSLPLVAQVGAGAAYGMVWWLLGALVLMPARLGMPLFQLDAMAWKSLMGHVMFGMVLALGSAMLARREGR